MKVRHRIPSIFNLSMVDVLCCALGCVILLWLLNLREAKQKADTVGETSQMLAATQSRLEDLMRQAEDSSSQLRVSQERLRELLVERDRAAQAAEALRKERDRLSQDFTKAIARAGELTRAQRMLSQEKTENLQQLAGMAVRLRDAEEQLKKAKGMAALVPGLRGDAEGYRGKLAEAVKRIDDLQMQVRQAGQNIVTLEADKKALAQNVARAKHAAENRFAGINLTGRRVLFVVDMSGSMDLLDEKTPAEGKWLLVRQTLAQIMRSLNNLEKFQVVLFSDKVAYLLGHQDSWLDYDPKTSADQALKAMAAVEPKGNTNIFSALRAAFRFRQAGMDTIYFISDGLPTAGEGLSPQAAQSMSDTERSALLARHIRQTLKTDWNAPGQDGARVRINTIGFFYESPEVGAFLWALARENDGSFVGMSKP